MEKELKDPITLATQKKQQIISLVNIETNIMQDESILKKSVPSNIYVKKLEKRARASVREWVTNIKVAIHNM